MPPSPPLTSPNQQRQPPPSLFLGPPSHNASHVSLPSAPAPGAAPPPAAPTSSVNPRTAVLRTRSSRNVPTRPDGGPVDPGSIASPLRPAGPRQQQQQDEGRKQADHTDALWAEMQSTLEEVELSAVSGTHVFGAEHSRALEELRTAQIALAQAWARSEADEATDMGAKDAPVVKGAAMMGLDKPVGTGSATDHGTEGSPLEAGAGSARKARRGSKLEEETENDILLARKRREANDRYFQRVNGGVLEVVSKLEDVAAAMRGVEQESRDIWSESDDTTSASASVAAGAGG